MDCAVGIVELWYCDVVLCNEVLGISVQCGEVICCVAKCWACMCNVL